MLQRWMPVLVWIGVILGLSSIPSLGPAGRLFTGSDKIVHTIEYAVLGFFFARARGLPSGAWWRIAALSAVFGLAIGSADEWYQRSVPGRTSDVYDALADCIGATLGATIAVHWFRRRAAQQKQRSG